MLIKNIFLSLLKGLRHRKRSEVTMFKGGLDQSDKNVCYQDQLLGKTLSNPFFYSFFFNFVKQLIFVFV